MKEAQLNTSQPARKPDNRIEYLDGIRGLAALAVVFVHVFEAFGLDMQWAGIYSDGRLTNAGLDKLIPVLANISGYGAYAVEIFIVVSGYSLMLSVARSLDGRPKGGLRGYFTRRIRRIWPPYYAALAICLLMIFLIPGLNTPDNTWWDQSLPAFQPDVLISHVLFLHHLSPAWLQKINPALWTIAIEEWIYILFPFTLLPIWRRFGSLPMAITGIIISSAAWYLFYPILRVANPWYLGLFAMGALGASIGFSNRPNEQNWRARLPWLKLSIGFAFAWAIFDLMTKKPVINRLGFDLGTTAPWIIDVALGAAIVSLLIHLTKRCHENKGDHSVGLLAVLQHPLIVRLGTFTYSLYLIHPPIIASVALLAVALSIRSWPAYLFMIVVGVPASLFGAFLFHTAFERPFLPSYLAQAREKPKAQSGEQPVASSIRGAH
jgi:peptidoglycan/LPS O-acetylase OafA/YrhL